MIKIEISLYSITKTFSNSCNTSSDICSATSITSFICSFTIPSKWNPPMHTVTIPILPHIFSIKIRVICFMNYLLARCNPLILCFYICLRTILYSSSIWKYGQLSDEPDNILARSSSSKFTWHSPVPSSSSIQ